MSSHWQKWITKEGHVRVVGLEASALAVELISIQGLGPLSQGGLAEAVVGALLIASTHKSNESINLNAKGSAHYRQAIVDASPDGRARGFLITNENSSVADWGTGVLSILYTKTSEGKQPYTGMVAITDGSLETALNDYYRDSEQLVSRVGLDVRVENGTLSARGLLIQALGGATDAERARIENLDTALVRDLTARVNDADFGARVAQALAESQVDLLETTALKSFCTCGIERIERALLLTGEADTREALGEDPHLSITCDFCRSQYTVTAARVNEMFARDPSHLQ